LGCEPKRRGLEVDLAALISIWPIVPTFTCGFGLRLLNWSLLLPLLSPGVVVLPAVFYLPEKEKAEVTCARGFL